MTRLRTSLVAAAIGALLVVPAAASAQQPAPEKKPDSTKAEAPKAAAQPEAPKADAAAKAEVKAEAKAEVKTEQGDVTPATALQVLAAVTDAAASAKALEGATVTTVRIVNVKDALNASSQTAFDLAVQKNAADIAKLRTALTALEPVKSALAAATVPAEKVVGASIAAGVVTVFHQ